MTFEINGKQFNLANIIIMMHSNAAFVCGETYESLEWFSQNIDKPTLEQIQAWVDKFEPPTEPESPLGKDWDKLSKTLTGSAIFAKAYAASKITLSCNSAFTLLMTTITTTNNEETLKFALSELLASMKSSTKVDEYTSEDLELIEEILDDAGFDGLELVGAA